MAEPLITVDGCVPVGMVHGRFQPFHLEQLDYVLSGLRRCNQLVIGIANPDPGQYRLAPESDRRHLQESNPFSFYDRLRMVKASLLDAGVDWSRVAVVPFHLLDSGQWPHYLPDPRSVVHFVRVFSDSEERKAAKLRDYGFEVVQIDEGRQKTITATQVRTLISDGGDWRSLVPTGTARIVDELHGMPHWSPAR